MIAHINGNLLKKSPSTIVVENNGIGYEITVPLSTFYELPLENERVSLHIYTHVREDTLSLFGFKSIEEKEIFLKLISISGIGPKLAINILSGIGPKELEDAIIRGDIPRIKAIPGVGKKTAERIVLELRDRVKEDGKGRGGKELPLSSKANQVFEDALSALINLGYSTKDAKRALNKAIENGVSQDLESLIKESLKVLI